MYESPISIEAGLDIVENIKCNHSPGIDIVENIKCNQSRVELLELILVREPVIPNINLNIFGDSCV